MGRPILPIGSVGSDFYGLLSDLRLTHMTHRTCSHGLGQPPIGSTRPIPILRVDASFFIFVFFKKKLQKYIFGFRFYSSIPPPPGRGGGRGPIARQVGGRDLYVKKICAVVLGGSLPPHQLAAGGRQAPSSNIKLCPFPRVLIFCPRDPERGEGERRGE